MFDVLDDLENAVDKIAADEGVIDVERISKLAERLEFQRLRAVGGYDRSCVWAAEGFVSPVSAVRVKARCSPGLAMRSVRLARKLESLSEVAAAFGAGDITREHVVEIAHGYTPERAAMIEGIEAELVNAAKVATPAELRVMVQRVTDAFDADGGAGRDKKEHALNRVTLSSTSGGRGILNGSLDAELTDIVLTALDAEMEVLRVKGETRRAPELRAAAADSIFRQYLASRGDTGGRGRGQTHLSAVVDVAQYAESNAELVALIRNETAHGGRLSRNTLERLSCDCKISRVIMDGPSCVLDVGWATRTVSNAQWNALVARDKHCQGKNCERGPGFCEAHHIWHWEHGGPTNLENLELLCWWCHRERHIRDALTGIGSWRE
jgi:Domain of unknown function (DUF222)/HNH endonuclease